MSNTGSSTGTLSNGQSYGTGLANSNQDPILLGGGAVYIVPIEGMTAIPNDSDIEVDKYNVGWCESGAKITYKPKLTSVYNQYDQLVKRFITRENMTFKTGILSWNLDNISKLSNAQIIEATSETLEKRVVFTGSGALNTILLRFVHEKEDGNKIRFTMVGQGGNGFGLDFSDKATSIDAEIEAIQYFKNFFAEFREEFSKDEIPTPTSNTPN